MMAVWHFATAPRIVFDKAHVLTVLMRETTQIGIMFVLKSLTGIIYTTFQILSP